MPEFRSPVTNVSPNVTGPDREGDAERLTGPLAVAAGMLLVLGIAAALTLHAHPGRILGVGQTGQAGGQAGHSGRPTPGAATTAPAVGLVPRPGQVLVTGIVTSLTASNASSSPLKPPFTITVAVGGQGGANITGVQVGGRAAAISWYAGRPLPVSGSGTLNLAGAQVTVNPSGITWALDGAARQLTPGRYFLGAPVAVGRQGSAQPVDSVTFVAGPNATVDTSGGAVAHLPPASIHLGGPGRVTLQGQLTVRTASGVKTVTSVTLGTAPRSYSFSIDLVPGPGGYLTKDAILQGPVKAT